MAKAQICRVNPPFTMGAQIVNQAIDDSSDSGSLFPALYQTNRDSRFAVTHQSRLQRIKVHVPSTVRDYLEESFDVERLDQVQSWLWIAGLPKIARPLNKQLSKGRSIIITEQADCHLVWLDDKIFIKPLPEFLLAHRTWSDYLDQNSHLRSSAIGFVLSYLWLINEHSDFCIAKEHHLIPAFVQWQQWTTFAASVYDFLYDRGELRVDIPPRYRCGELRLRRLNHIYRLRALMSPRSHPIHMFHAYREMYTTYSSFFDSNTKWFISAAVYFGVVMAAMQVALATERFDSNSLFSTVCMCFALITILMPTGVITITITILLISFGFNASHAFSAKKRLVKGLKERKRPRA